MQTHKKKHKRTQFNWKYVEQWMFFFISIWTYTTTCASIYISTLFIYNCVQSVDLDIFVQFSLKVSREVLCSKKWKKKVVIA